MQHIVKVSDGAMDLSGFVSFFWAGGICRGIASAGSAIVEFYKILKYTIFRKKLQSDDFLHVFNIKG